MFRIHIAPPVDDILSITEDGEKARKNEPHLPGSDGSLGQMGYFYGSGTAQNALSPQAAAAGGMGVANTILFIFPKHITAIVCPEI